jgi:DNA-binding NtrC family response regulator
MDNNINILEYTTNLDILFVGDNINLASQHQELLNRLFKKVVYESNTKNALKEYQNFYVSNNRYFDIVLIELTIPILHGEELLQKIKHLNKDQKIIIISEHLESSGLIKLINYGVADILCKPIDTLQLQESLYKVSKDLNKTNELNNLSFLHEEDDLISF